MKIEQLYTGCLSHAAYYIESDHEAAIFDPLREVEPYIEKAKADGATIKYVFETHFHADFVSGHLDLKRKTGARIVFGPTAKPGYDAIIAEDNQVFSVGKMKVKVLHTPGHTMESTTYLLIDEEGDEHALITGDTLFIGDVGRPDLAQHVNAELTERKLAGHLYDSLRNKIMPLPDHLIIYPNHGAGSACGKMMSKETVDTLGHQKKVNYALDTTLTKEAFIDKLLNGLTTPPGYFPQNVLMNLKGYECFDDILERSNQPLSVDEFIAVAENKDVLILDTREADEFAAGFIPGSLNVGVRGNFAQWVGEMIPQVNQQLLLVAEPGDEVESITRLSRVGYDAVTGYLNGGYPSWEKAGGPHNTVTRISAAAFEEKLKAGKMPVFDIRKKSEYDSECVCGAINIPLNEMRSRINEFPKHEPFVIYCAGGYRSMIAASVLKQSGIENFADVRGGFSAIKKTTAPLTEFAEPFTML